MTPTAILITRALPVRASVQDRATKMPGSRCGFANLCVTLRAKPHWGGGFSLFDRDNSPDAGTVVMTESTCKPMLNVDRGVYRFRVLNGSNARMFRLAFNNGAPFTLMGNDGGLLRSPVNVTEILLGMGERVDVLVDFSGLQAGQSVMLRCLAARWDLVQFVGTGAPGVAYTPPVVLSTIESLVGPSQPTRTFTFDGMSRINGLEYDMNRIDFRAPFGVAERWRFKTGGNAPHPVHVHGASFQVVSRTGGRGRPKPNQFYLTLPLAAIHYSQVWASPVSGGDAASLKPSG
jgi:FtsP/CotA-like multicopper oxidase with cupredoxin domain